MSETPLSTQRKASMSDVARHAGVSPMTVSNVINRPEIVSERTQQRVKASMDALSYRNNLMARSLRLALPRQVGYLMSTRRTAGDPYMDEFLHDLAGACEERGRNLTLVSAQKDEIAACEELYYGQAVAGFLVSNVTLLDARMAALHDRDIPVVAYGQDQHGVDAPWSWADVDAARGLGLVVEHLERIGHTELAYLGIAENAVPMKERRRGYTDACVALGLDQAVQPSRIIEGGREISDGVSAAATLLDSPHPPTAIACATDQLALGAVLAARDRGLRLGKHIAISGFDDSSLAQVGGTGITSVHQPVHQLASILVDMLIDTTAAPRNVLLEPELVVRSSTVTPAA